MRDAQVLLPRYISPYCRLSGDTWLNFNI